MKIYETHSTPIKGAEDLQAIRHERVHGESGVSHLLETVAAHGCARIVFLFLPRSGFCLRLAGCMSAFAAEHFSETSATIRLHFECGPSRSRFLTGSECQS